MDILKKSFLNRIKKLEIANDAIDFCKSKEYFKEILNVNISNNINSYKA